MPMCLAYHTLGWEYPPETRNVYHDYDDCPHGEIIKPWHREYGRAFKRRCETCAKNDAELFANQQS